MGSDRGTLGSSPSTQLVRNTTIIRAPLRLSGIVYFALLCLVSSAANFGWAQTSSSFESIPQIPRQADNCTEAAGLVETARVLHSQGQLNSSQEALARYGQALMCWRSIRAYGNAAETLRSIGDIYYETGQYQMARDSYQQALADSRKIADLQGQSLSLISIGLVDVYLDQSDDSLARTNEAALLSQNLQDDRIRAQILNNYVFAYINRGSGGDLANAARSSNEAVALAEKVNDPVILGRTMLFAGYVKNDSGNLSEALDYYQRALSLFQKYGNPAWQSRALAAIGGVYVATGEPQQALNHDEDALALQKQLGDRRMQGTTFNNIGYAYEELGDFEHALDNYLSALDCYRELGHQRGEAQTSVFVGNMYRILGDFAKARKYYEVSQTLARGLDDKVLDALALTNLGLLAQDTGDLRGAISTYSRALAVYNRIGDQRGQVINRNALGYALNLSDQKEGALRHLLRALSLVEKTQDRELEVLVRYNLAHVLGTLGQLDKARSQIETSLHLIESQRLKLASFELRSSYFASVRQFYELHADILMQLHRNHPGDGLDAKAFEVSERARARSLLESLKESEANIRADADADLVEKKRTVQRQLNEASVRRAQLSPNADRVELDAVMKEIDRLTTLYQELEARMRSNSARYAAMPPPEPLGLKDSQLLLDDNSILLEYMLGDKCSYLWAITPSELYSYELPPRSQIESIVTEFHDLLTANQPVEGETYEQLQARVAKARTGLLNDSVDLGKILLGPIAGKLGNKRLLIVPDGILQSIPFQALTIPDVGGSSLSLLEEHEIIYEPSASTLGMVVQTDAHRKPGSGSVVVFADPVFDGDDPRVESAKFKSASDMPERTQQIKQALRDVGIQGTGRIPPLPASREEADAIISSVPWRTGFKAVDFQASRQTIEQTDFSQYRILHFATHGFVDYQHPELSGLVLSMVDEKGQPQDGYLRMHDIYNLKVPVDLVVLSSCNSGLGKEVKGEGLIGLTRGFMYAGAGGVVASLWKVDDDATAELMKHFYEGMFQRGLTPAAALREAQLYMSRQKRWQSPYYWAAFVIQGQYNQKDLAPPTHSIFDLASLITSVILFSIAAALVVRWRRKTTIRIE